MKTVLIAVSGLSPAILTETVWALAHPSDGSAPVIVDEVVVITTSRGAADIRRDLETPSADQGGLSVWHALRNALKQSVGASRQALQLTAPRVIELPDLETGIKMPAADLRSPEDNTQAADFILDVVRPYVENKDTRVIASIAGGRKTMGALLYSAMSLLGRETDRVTHVLVSEPFDLRLFPAFFFPASSPVSHELRNFKGEVLSVHSSADARIDLADIPFVPLRNRFEDLRDMPGSFNALVLRFSNQLRTDAAKPAVLVLCHRRRTLRVDGVTVDLRPKALAILHFLLECNESGNVPLDQKGVAEAMEAWLRNQPRSFAGDIDSDRVPKELNFIRERLKKAGVSWAPPLRNLALPPFVFHLEL